MGREALTEFWDETGRPPGGLGRVGDPPKGTGGVGRPSRKSVRGRESHPEVRDRL